MVEKIKEKRAIRVPFAISRIAELFTPKPAQIIEGEWRKTETGEIIYRALQDKTLYRFQNPDPEEAYLQLFGKLDMFDLRCFLSCLFLFWNCEKRTEVLINDQTHNHKEHKMIAVEFPMYNLSQQMQSKSYTRMKESLIKLSGIFFKIKIKSNDNANLIYSSPLCAVKLYEKQEARENNLIDEAPLEIRLALPLLFASAPIYSLDLDQLFKIKSRLAQWIFWKLRFCEHKKYKFKDLFEFSSECKNFSAWKSQTLLKEACSELEKMNFSIKCNTSEIVFARGKNKKNRPPKKL